MKKMLAITLSLTIILSLCACGNDKPSDTNEKDNADTNIESVVEETEDDETEDEKEEKNEENKLLSGVYQVPLEEVYIDIPAFNMIESGYSTLFMINDLKYVAFTCLYNEVGTSGEDAFQETFNKLKDNLHGYHQVNELNEVEENNVNVNGIETYCIKGTVNCGTENKYDAYIYGYSFVFGGYPCSIIGVVEDKAQTQDDIDNITEIVDAMMKSVRSEK